MCFSQPAPSGDNEADAQQNAAAPLLPSPPSVQVALPAGANNGSGVLASSSTKGTVSKTVPKGSRKQQVQPPSGAPKPAQGAQKPLKAGQPALRTTSGSDGKLKAPKACKRPSSSSAAQPPVRRSTRQAAQFAKELITAVVKNRPLPERVSTKC